MPEPQPPLPPAIIRFLSVSRQWLLGAAGGPRPAARASTPSTPAWPAHQARLRAMWIAHGQQR
ncbi:MAG: hypothetical protein KGQ67_07705 [Betaproteobacteria bacterium]|nr:hypothetical protein [Betaproteobacteria bacterium]